jgi:hypothetical protein
VSDDRPIAARALAVPSICVALRRSRADTYGPRVGRFGDHHHAPSVGLLVAESGRVPVHRGAQKPSAIGALHASTRRGTVKGLDLLIPPRGLDDSVSVLRWRQDLRNDVTLTERSSTHSMVLTTWRARLENCVDGRADSCSGIKQDVNAEKAPNGPR